MKKRAELTSENTISLILAAAFIILIVYLIVQFLQPSYDPYGEYAEAQLGAIVNAIQEADRTEQDVIHTIVSAPRGAVYVLAYFGKNHNLIGVPIERATDSENKGNTQGNFVDSFSGPNTMGDFYQNQESVNTLCVCFSEGHTPEIREKSEKHCLSCLSLDKPVENFRNTLTLTDKVQLKIRKVGEHYEITYN